MNINALLEMTQTVNLNSDIANKFVSSKTNNTEFTGMFDNVMNKYNVNNDTNSNGIEIDDTKIDKTETKVKTDEIKSDDSLKEIDDNDSYEKVDFDDEDKEAFHKEATKALSALLNMFNEKPELIEKYFNVNEDGSYELNVDAINDLQIDFSEYLLDNNIQIDMNILNNDESFNFESLLDTTLNFVKDEANDEVNFINVFTKDNSNEEIISSDLSNEVITDDVTFDETYINKNENIDIKDNINISDKQVVDDITNTNADTKDDFEILKNTINQMIDEVTVEDSSEEVEVINEVNVKEEIKISDEKITEDIEVVNEEVSEEITNEVKDETVNDVKEDEEIFDDKENVKDKKEHKNVKEQKVETRNEFDIQNGSENKIEVSDDLKDVIEYNSASDSVTDRYIETIEVAKQMVKGIEVKLSENVQEMHVKLDPENLGKVNLKIVAENGLVTAKFEAESQKVKEIIESNLSLLKESLEKRGIQISNLEVSVGQNMQGNSNQRNLDEMRKIALEKNPHKILGKGIKIFSNTAEINNSELKKRGLFMTRSKVNYIA